MQNQNLWAPWRMAYLRGLDQQADDVRGDDALPETSSDFFADYWSHPERDDAQHVIARTDDGMIMLNRYPYANGHLLVALGDARPTLLDYDADQRAALWRLVDSAADLMHRTINPQGINIGINDGSAAGAGVPEHVHVHLVPRWHGDTNFMTTVGAVRVIPDALDAMAADYRRVWIAGSRGTDGR